MSKYKWKNITGVGLGIVAFEGTEHLANIITEIKDCVDYVVIGLQKVSYHGDNIDPADLAEIYRLRDEDHLVDEILEINLDTTKFARVQEAEKRTQLVEDIEKHNCSHAIIIDSDEFYTKNSFLRGLKEIDDNNYEITYCRYINYYKDYQHQLVYPFDKGMFVPFISKSKYKFEFDEQDEKNPVSPSFPLPSDPTRRVVRPYSSIKKVKLKDGRIFINKHFTVDYHVFEWNEVKMHHLSCNRANIRKKFDNWSSKKCFENYNDLVDKAVDTYNYFNTETNKEQFAHLLFNTPGHKVKVSKFDKQYIYPKYDIYTRLRQVKQYKNILILNLSSTNSKVNLFENLEKTCRETWAKDVLNNKYDNIDYYSVIDCKEESYIDNNTHTIYIKTDYNKNNIQQLLNRYLEAYKLISTYKNTNENIQYDYIIRTNTSTWCNIELLNEFLANEYDNSITYTYNLFSAFWSTFNIYCSGALTIMHNRTIEILNNLVEKETEDFLNLAYDDVMMSALLLKRAKDLKLKYPNKIFSSLEGKYLLHKYEDTNFSNIDFNIPIYQIKTMDVDENIRIIDDIKKMKELEEKWQEYKLQNINIFDMAKDLRENRLDKTIYVIDYFKQDWLAKKVKTYKDKYENIMPYNVETLNYLENKAKIAKYR